MAVLTKKKGRENVFYLNYDNIQPYINDGTINAYDEILTRDRGIKYFIDGNMNIIEVKSRNYIYNSEADALAALANETTGYLAGQLIAIKDGDIYQAYTISYANGQYSIAKVCEGIIDYNRMENIPIQNKIANAQDNLVLSELSDGYYNVLGTFKISPIESTTHIVTSSVLFSIKHQGSDVYIRPLDAVDNEIYKVDVNGDIDTKEIPTMDQVENEIDNYVDTNSATQADIENLFQAN